MAARDPHRYLDNPIADETGQLLPAWRELLLRFPDRFMTGADPVWPIENIQSWYEADSGWDRLGEFLDFHRTWLKGLPPEVAAKVRLHNAQRFFGNPGIASRERK